MRGIWDFGTPGPSGRPSGRPHSDSSFCRCLPYYWNNRDRLKSRSGRRDPQAKWTHPSLGPRVTTPRGPKDQTNEWAEETGANSHAEQRGARGTCKVVRLQGEGRGPGLAATPRGGRRSEEASEEERSILCCRNVRFAFQNKERSF